jgi:hypothetical protein
MKDFGVLSFILPTEKKRKETQQKDFKKKVFLLFISFLLLSFFNKNEK